MAHLCVNGNTVLDSSNYTTFCATSDHGHSQYLTNHQDISGKANTSGTYSDLRVGQLAQATLSEENSAIPNANSFAVYKMTSSSAVGGDGHIMSFTWAGTTTYGAQIYVDTDPTYNISIRQRDANGTWKEWKPIITGANIGSQSVNYSNYSGYANLLAYQYDNEINFKGNKPASCYFNYRNGTDGSTDAAIATTYLFCNYGKGTSNTSIQAGTFKATSDINEKENLEEYIADVSKLQAYSYNFKQDADKTRHVGLIAQQVEAICPEAVDNINGVKTLDYNAVVALLVEEVKTLKKRVEQLEHQ